MLISLQCTYTQVESDENETDRTRRDDTDTNNTMETDTSHNDLCLTKDGRIPGYLKTRPPVLDTPVQLLGGGEVVTHSELFFYYEL